MFSRSVHNSISLVLTFSVAWHCIVGCCGHHGHAHADSGTHSCGQKHDSDSEHTSCYHRCDSGSARIEFVVGESIDVATCFNENSETSHCLGSKCAFVPGENSPQLKNGRTLTFDLNWQYISLHALTLTLVGNRPLAFKPPTSIGASSARPQQLLCVWLI